MKSMASGMRGASGYVAACAAVGILAGVAGVGAESSAGIEWEKQGAFQACLEYKAVAWIGAKVELVVNDDPDMGAINDHAVAVWATQAVKECTAKSPADPASELRFMKYMAHWRDHIYKAAEEVRRKSRPD